MPSSMFFFSSRRRHTSSTRDWSSDVCSSDLSYFLGQFIKAAGENDVGKLAGRAEVRIGRTPACQLTPQILTQDVRRCDRHRSEERRVGKEWRSRSRLRQQANSGEVVSVMRQC